MKRLAIGAALVAAAVLLGGCDDATTGTVTDKVYDPAWLQMNPTYGTNGQLTGFSQTWWPECYKLGFHNQKDNEDGSVCTDHATWDTYKLGDIYPKER